MPRARASVIVERPKLLGVNLRLALVLANPLDWGTVQAPHAPRRMSVREAARHVGISAPAMLAILNGTRTRIGVLTAAGLWMLWRELKRRALRERAQRTELPQLSSTPTKAEVSRLRVAAHKVQLENDLEGDTKIKSLEALLALHDELQHYLHWPTPAASSAAGLRRRARRRS